MAQDQGVIARRQIAPLAQALSAVHPRRAPRTLPAAQRAARDRDDIGDQSIPIRMDRLDAMTFQPQAFPDTSFQEHRCRPPSYASDTHEG